MDGAIRDHSRQANFAPADSFVSLSYSSAKRRYRAETSTGLLARPVHGLLLDDTDVLYDTTAWRRWLLRVLAQLGLKTHYHSFFHIWDHDFLGDVHSGRRSFHDAFGQFLLTAGLSRAQIDEVEAATQGRRTKWEDTVRPLPGIRTTLLRLSAAGMKLGVLSDSLYPAAALKRRLRRMGLAGVFSTVISSQDLGRTKPNPLGYLAAADTMGLAPEEIAFVGHSMRELVGAQHVGMQTITFNPDPDAEADLCIARFEELLGLVDATRCRVAAA